MPKSITWFIFTRGVVPPYRLEIALRGVRVFGTKYNGTRVDRVLHTSHGLNLTWAWDEAQLFAVGKNVIRKCSTRAGQERHFRSIQNSIDRANRAAERARHLDLRGLSQPELIKFQHWLFQETGPAHGFLDIDIDAVDAVLENFMYEKIRRNIPICLSEKQYIALFKKLSVPIHQTYVAEEELAIERAIRKGLPAADVFRLYERYWWTGLGWEQVNYVNENIYLKKLLQYLRNRPAQKKLDRMAILPSLAAKNRTKILQRYHCRPAVKYWLRVLDRYAYYHDRRKEMQCRTMYAFHLWLREAARRLRVPVNDLEWYYSHEIIRLLRGRKFDRADLARRKKTLLALVDRSSFTLLSGQRALAKRNQLLGTIRHNDTAIKGVGVTKGIVRARARVCNGVAEARQKVKAGDVLVCGMTLPEYVPVMKRAAAIVTDEGGITCHAAIVAREMHKPCVVGTRIATKVFRDGDWVEVNAGAGTVRKVD
ncbi:MAG: PEP-utilizing enzyme [Patescibacteria group bacterium]